MPRAKQSKGKCTYCGQEIAKSAVSKHLLKCVQRQEAIAKAEHNKGRAGMIFHLRIQAAGSKAFWLDLEVRATATLEDLDAYLRSIWLECCGHLSRFSVGGWGSDEISKSRKMVDIVRMGVELTHIYDFGTSSETLIKPMGLRAGKTTNAKAITLMVRNMIPKWECIECGQPAAWLCQECIIEDDEWGTLCDEHAKTHPHGNYGEPEPIVNSPRLGLCGYTGPADPPY